jgi:hypothetical protein
VRDGQAALKEDGENFSLFKPQIIKILLKAFLLVEILQNVFDVDID